MAQHRTDLPTCPYSHPIDTAPRLNLHPRYHEIRETDGGVTEITLASGHHEDGRRVWLVTRHADVESMFQDQHTFSREHADGILGTPPVAHTLLGLDLDEHVEVRDLVRHAFKRSPVGAQRPMIRATVQDLLDAMEGGSQPADLFAGFALPLALGVIGTILGVPEEDRAQFGEWGNAFLGTGSMSQEAAAEAAMNMWVYLAGQLERRRENPTGDLMSDIVRLAPEGMAPEKLVSLPLAIFTAGWETTASMTTMMTLWLLTNPYGGADTGWRYLAAHPEEIPGAVQELLRVLPVDAGDQLPRRVMQDVELGGVQIRAGDIVIASPSAANFDSGVFDDAHQVDFARNPNPHRAFGYGAHHCLGSLLAAAELEEALGGLTGRFPGLRLAGAPEDVEWKTGVSVRGPSRMLVAWD